MLRHTDRNETQTVYRFYPKNDQFNYWIKKQILNQPLLKAENCGKRGKAQFTYILLWIKICSSAGSTYDTYNKTVNTMLHE